MGGCCLATLQSPGRRPRLLATHILRWRRPPTHARRRRRGLSQAPSEPQASCAVPERTSQPAMPALRRPLSTPAGGGLLRGHHRPVLPPLPGRNLLRPIPGRHLAHLCLRDAYARDGWVAVQGRRRAALRKPHSTQAGFVQRLALARASTNLLPGAPVQARTACQPTASASCPTSSPPACPPPPSGSTARRRRWRLQASL